MAAPSAGMIFRAGGCLTVLPCLRGYSVFCPNGSKSFPRKFLSIYNNTDRSPNRQWHFQPKNEKSVAHVCSKFCMNHVNMPSLSRHKYARVALQTGTLTQSYLSRSMTTGLTDDMIRKKMEKLTDRFMEAKELLDDARESIGSVYFNEDLRDADKAVEETLADYQSLLGQLDEEKKRNVISTIGLRMEELSAHQKMIRESLKE